MGTAQPAATKRRLISGTAAAASGTLTVHLTISDPASASSTVCRNVASTSAVSVLVIDWTTIGAPPPTRTCATCTPYVLRRGRPASVPSVPAICVSILIYFSSQPPISSAGARGSEPHYSTLYPCCHR